MSAPKKAKATEELRELRERMGLLRECLREHHDYAEKLNEMAEKTSSDDLRLMLNEECFKASAQVQGLLWAVKILDGTEVQMPRAILTK